MERDVAILLLRMGFLAILYLFLLVLLLMLWRDLASPRSPKERTTVAVALSIVDPGSCGRSVGELLALEPITSVGRDTTNTLVLLDPSVSAEHALLTYRQRQWWLNDLASTNGTYLNGVRIERPTIVKPGDTIRLGVVSLRLQV